MIVLFWVFFCALCPMVKCPISIPCIPYTIPDSIQNAKGPLLIEIEKPPGIDLGVNLISLPIENEKGMFIDGIVQGSVADRLELRLCIDLS